MKTTTEVWYTCDTAGTDKPITMVSERWFSPICDLVEAAAQLRSQMFHSIRGVSGGSMTHDNFTRGALSSNLSGPQSKATRSALRRNYPESL